LIPIQPAIRFPLLKKVTFPGALEVAEIEAVVLSDTEVGTDKDIVAGVKFILTKVT
jgi:hypothetical protein